MADRNESWDVSGSALLAGIGWIIRLRWAAIAGVYAVAGANDLWLGLLARSLPLYVIGLMMMAYNGAFHALHIRFKTMPRQTAIWFGALQMALDLVAFTALIHFSGGVENPLLFYLVLHIVLSGLWLPAGITYALAAMACLMVGGMILLEDIGVLAHHSLIGFLPAYVWDNPPYMLGVAILLAGAVFLAAYLTSSATKALRRREMKDWALRARLANQEKLATLGQVAAGIAHEIGNLVASIAALTELALNRTEDAQMVSDLKSIKGQVGRISTMLREIMDFARPAASGWRKVIIHDVIEDALKILRYDPRLKSANVIKAFSADVPASYVMDQQMTQVFTNILLNALDAMERRDGSITIRTGLAKGDISVVIEDTGVGMTPETLAHAFEPFFSTKPEGKGTGLGLAVSREIVQRHSGTIMAESEAGKGSRITITLPVRAAPEAGPQDRAQPS